ncbi:hypothetical protein PHACT_03195 [Pseudohongiella acticola]|jgi:uncharacterized protein DUF4920|uniref:DUF4920 domain-containing protein n=1 Tax=Pseudohongiella acticola TaxID=1524254 RepID=A0A1E8CIE0_9GAMM|nr:DUF4920 domain-containing protein [Pseudohongiella acticola]OFE12260.1 hypothetical protein PHACT_03195 [Pseudohongiella acticola]
MNRLITLALLLLCTTATQAEQYGAPVTDGRSSTVPEAIASVDAGHQGTLLVEAEVTSVCQAKGCWLGFSSDAGDVRVTFKDYGFFVPFSVRGKIVRAEGTMEKVELSLEDSKHLIEDAGGDPTTVTQPIIEYQFVATGVDVLS